jgi:hypothetical protein
VALALAVAAVLVAGGCGGTSGGGSGSTVTPSDALAAVEHAAGVPLAQNGGFDGTDVATYYENDSVVKEKQVIVLAVAKDAAKLAIARQTVAARFQGVPAKLRYTRKNVFVFYYATFGGQDRSAAIKKAIDGL